jgi:acetyltransferase-like isoleucine patch superfamily enzyme
MGFFLTMRQIAKSAEIDESVVFGANCREVSIGHGTRIRGNVYIDVDHLTIGDYVTINPGTVIHGDVIEIGHNCWIGRNAMLDGHGGLLRIGNNVGIGADSQLWSHIKFGDRLEGCNWYKMEKLIVDDDVWFVGHCLVASIHAKKRSMLMLGGVATHDMEENQIYAGVPARNMSTIFGNQFRERTTEEKKIDFLNIVEEYKSTGRSIDFIEIVGSRTEVTGTELSTTRFDLENRTYCPRYTDEETEFMRFLLYDRAKFLPSN